MRTCVALLLLIVLTSCGNRPPVVVSVDTMCQRIDRYHATDAQRAAFKADQTTWESLVNYLLGIDKTLDQRCSQPVAP